MLAYIVDFALIVLLWYLGSIFAALTAIPVSLSLNDHFLGAAIGGYKIACEITCGRSLGQWARSIKPFYPRGRWWRAPIRNSWLIAPYIGWWLGGDTWAANLSFCQLVISLSLLLSTSKRHLLDLATGAKVVQAP